jgi:GTP cyclohydrolase I
MVEGWGVEIALLIDTWRAVGMRPLAQVDLGVREHRNRPLDELALSAMAILSTVLDRAGVASAGDASIELLRFAGEAGVEGVPVRLVERPPMRTRPGYRPGRTPSTPFIPSTPSTGASSHADRIPPAAPEPAVTTTIPPALTPEGLLSPPGVDRDRVARAVTELLEAIGEDPNRDGLVRTPERVAEMYVELCSGLHDDPARHLDVRFDADHDELILVRDIAFASLCEHHLMPFTGRAHVGYIPGVDGRVTGLSKLARLVEGFARRPQVQERLTTQIADALESRLSPRGVVVMIEAEHLCMSMRGVSKPGAVTVTSAVRGVLRDDAAARAEAMSILHGSRRH